jgi:hypothetical protein
MSRAVEHDAFRNRLFPGYAFLKFPHAHRRGGEIKDDVSAVSRRNAEGNRIGAGHALHAAVQRRRSRANADGAHRDHAGIRSHFHVIGQPPRMTRMTQTNQAGPMFFGLLYGQIHCSTSRDLADVVVTFDNCRDFSFADNLWPLSKIDRSVMSPCQIGRNARHTVTRIPAQIGFHEQPRNEFGIAFDHAAGQK